MPYLLNQILMLEPAILSFIFITLVLLIAAWSDIKKRIIPNFLVIGGIVILLLWQTYTQTLQPLSLFIGLVVGLTLWQLKLIGGGDSKLIIFVSAAFAASQLPVLYLCISLAGSVQALFYMHQKQNSLPYAVAILGGTIVFALLLSGQI